MKKQSIKEKFLSIVGSIPQSYTYLAEDKEELRNATFQLETQMVLLRSFAKDFKAGKTSLEKFKEKLTSLVNKLSK